MSLVLHHSVWAIFVHYGLLKCFLTVPSLFCLSSKASRNSLRHLSSLHSPFRYFLWLFTLYTPKNSENVHTLRKTLDSKPRMWRQTGSWSFVFLECQNQKLSYKFENFRWPWWLGRVHWVVSLQCHSVRIVKMYSRVLFYYLLDPARLFCHLLSGRASQRPFLLFASFSLTLEARNKITTRWRWVVIDTMPHQHRSQIVIAEIQCKAWIYKHPG